MIWLSRTEGVGALATLSALLCAIALVGCGGGAEEPGSRPLATAGTSNASPSPSTAPAVAAATQTTSGQGASTAGQPAGATSQSQADARTRADAICARRNRVLKGAPLAGGGLAATASNASRRAGIERRALAELSALPAPADATAQWTKMVEQTKAVFAEVAKLAQAARAGDRGAVTRELAAAAQPQFRLLAAAAKAGTRHCTIVG